MQRQKKSYYAIIPANVRYDKRLSTYARLMFGEITALCNEKGYCWASNSYFAKLYEVTPQAISKWVKKLAECNYIEVKYKREGKRIIQRNLSIIIDTYQPQIKGVSISDSLGYQPQVKENTILIINNTSVQNKIYGIEDYLKSLQIPFQKAKFSN